MASFRDDDPAAIDQPTVMAEDEVAQRHVVDTGADPAGPSGPADHPPAGEGSSSEPVHGGDQSPAVRPEPAVVQPVPVGPTRIGGIWVTVVVAMIILVFLLVFILQNLRSVTVHYLGASGSVPLGVALLMSALVGGLLVALVGAARIMQLRRIAKRRAQSTGSG